jgi:hypothetical protein
VTGPSLTASSAFGSVHSVLHSTAFDVAQNLVLLVAIVFWLGIAYWVFRDAGRRVDDPWLVWTAALLAFVVPLAGPAVYLLLRAPETLADTRARTLGVRALESRLGIHVAACPLCRLPVEPDFLVCPVCATRLRQACTECAAPLEPAWQVCPHCATPAAQADVAGPDLDAALTAEIGQANGVATPRRRAARVQA